jgi:hypothetical protein
MFCGHDASVAEEKCVEYIPWLVTEEKCVEYIPNLFQSLSRAEVSV